ncbi:MAG: twin-arginine translocase subunit TatB [Candidatus Hydrogenedentes bacterium]|nr:twin-arginine translocase subunit TatB [Candidatus Hydrogenedentota bacterium]
MLGIGFGEMILIAGVALIVFGPEKFPDFAKIVLRTVSDLRGYVDEIQQEVAKEIKPIKRELDQISKYDPEKYIDGLSKGITGNTDETPTASDGTSTTSKSESTEEEHDSCDYDDGSSGTPSYGDPYENASEDTSSTSPASTTEVDKKPVADVEPKFEQDVTNTVSEDTIDDFSAPPIERLD